MSYYKRRSHNVISDRSGFEYKADQVRREWNGHIVGNDEYEPRHPQSYIKARPERPGVKNPRPYPDDVFVAAFLMKEDGAPLESEYGSWLQKEDAIAQVAASSLTGG